MKQRIKRTELVGLSAAETIQRYSTGSEMLRPLFCPDDKQFACGIVPPETRHPTKLGHSVQKVFLFLANLAHGKFNLRFLSHGRKPNRSKPHGE